MDGDHLSCEDCFKFWKKARSDTPCGNCQKPLLEIANHPVWDLFHDLSSQARIAGMGGFVGFDYSGLGTLLQIHQFPESDWFLVLDKLRAITAVTKTIIKRDQERQKATKK